MNTSRVRFVLSVLFPLVCAVVLGARVEEFRSGYAPNALGQLTLPAQPVLVEDSNYQVAAYPAFALQLADGPGRAETQINCSGCHTPHYITMQPPLPAATWDAEVHKMIRTYGAQISEADTQKIIQYLQAHYTPETRK
jgi:hypothetical protein